MINTTMVEISPAAMTSWPIGLDRPVGSICAVCLKLRSAPRSTNPPGARRRETVRVVAGGRSGDEPAISALGRVVPCD